MNSNILFPCIIAVALLLPNSNAAAQAKPAPPTKTLNVLNWSDYIGTNTVARFSKTYAVKVNYDALDSDDSLQAKLLSGNSGYDVVYPSSTFMAQQIKAGVYDPLDWSRIPNRVNLDQALMAKLAKEDPGNKYGVPYVWGTDGMTVNVTKVRKLLGSKVALNSWDLLFKPEVVSKLAACKVSLVDSVSDVLPVVLAYMGRDPNSKNLEDYKAAFALLKKVRPYISQFNSTMLDAMASGDVCIAFTWSGDAGQIRRGVQEAKLPYEIRYVAPKGQTGLWFTTMGIPKDARNKANAYRWLNYLLDPHVAADITNEITYPNAVPASKKWINAAIVNDPVVYPSAAEINAMFVFRQIDSKLLHAINRMWLEFKSGK